MAVTFKMKGIRKALPLPFAHPFHVADGIDDGIQLRVDHVVANSLQVLPLPDCASR